MKTQNRINSPSVAQSRCAYRWAITECGRLALSLSDLIDGLIAELEARDIIYIADIDTYGIEEEYFSPACPHSRLESGASVWGCRPITALAALAMQGREHLREMDRNDVMERQAFAHHELGLSDRVQHREQLNEYSKELTMARDVEIVSISSQLTTVNALPVGMSTTNAVANVSVRPPTATGRFDDGLAETYRLQGDCGC